MLRRGRENAKPCWQILPMRLSFSVLEISFDPCLLKEMVRLRRAPLPATVIGRLHPRAIVIIRLFFTALFLTGLLTGCGSTNSRTATEQLLTSDAVDMAIAQIDFRPLTGQDVYLDSQYLKNFKGIGFTNAEYIISSLRQQIVAAGCYLHDDRDQAEFVVEARIGALGSDSHDIVYGIPASNALSTAASVVSGAPALPTIPEISFARKNDQSAAAKIAIFAYHRQTKQRVWQSGMALAKSSAKDMWLFGAGPFQSGTVYDGVQFAGEGLDWTRNDTDDPGRPLLSRFREPALFNPPALPMPQRMIAKDPANESADEGVVPASAEVEASAERNGD